MQRSAPTESFAAANLDSLEYEIGIEEYLSTRRFKVGVDAMQDEGWSLSSTAVQALLSKLKANGKPLGQYVKGKVYRGVLTGLNEAFVIDESTRTKLIAEDPKSEELIKPFLAGRDVKKYNTPSSNNYLILIPKGFTIKSNLLKYPYTVSEPPPRYGNMERTDAWDWFSNSFPAVAKYLLPYKGKAEARQDKGDYWWELRACDYYDEFEKPKILWPGISSEINPFAFDTNGFYGNDNNQLIVTDDLALLGILNSKTSNFYLRNTCDFVRGGFVRLKISYVVTLPIPKVTNSEKIVSYVTQILAAKEADPAADTTALEAEIDQLVYQLYNLTPEEIKIVEESVG